jgi:hypothetical protein
MEAAQNKIFGKETEQDTHINNLQARLHVLEAQWISHMQMKHREWFKHKAPWWKFWDRTPRWVFDYLNDPECDDNHYDEITYNAS